MAAFEQDDLIRMHIHLVHEFKLQKGDVLRQGVAGLECKCRRERLTHPSY